MATSWSSTKSIRDALKKTRATTETFFEGLSAFVDSHLKALRALTPDELAKMAAGEQGARTLGWVLEGARTGDPKLAVKLVDAIATPKNAKHLGPRLALNLLWSAQDDNLHQGVDPARLRRVLDVAVPFGERDAEIYVMAAFCAAELDAWDEVIELLAKAKAGRAKTLKKSRTEKLFKPLAKDPRFLALFGHKAPKTASKKLKPIAMANDDAIKAFRAFIAKHADAELGDVWPSAPKETNVEFWFANKSKVANDHFRQFASTGDGSLLALWNVRSRGFDKAPVVFLGGEGDLAILGANVPDTLALLARCGGEILDGAIAYGAEAPDPSVTTAWVETTFGRSITESPKKVVAAAGRAHGLADLKRLVKRLGTT